MKKKHAFWIGIVSLLGMFFATLLAAPAALPSIGTAVIAGVVGACWGFHGASVADNWQRSKYYRPELDERTGRP